MSKNKWNSKGDLFVQDVKKYIENNFVNGLINKYPELEKYENNSLFVPEGINCFRTSASELNKYKKAKFILRTEYYTKVDNYDPTKPIYEKQKGLFNPNVASRDIVLLELVHDKNGNLIYNKAGYPKYVPVPIFKIECKMSSCVNFNYNEKKVEQKLLKGLQISSYEQSIYLVGKLFKWISTDQEMKQKFPNFKCPDFMKKQLMSFFTSATQADNSFSIIAAEWPIKLKNKKLANSWNWISMDGRTFKQNKQVCPEIVPSLLQKFNNSPSKPKLPQKIQDILDWLCKKQKISQEDREIFKYGSDQRGRPLSVLDPSVGKNIVRGTAWGTISTDLSFFEDLYNCKNNSAKKSMKDVLMSNTTIKTI